MKNPTPWKVNNPIEASLIKEILTDAELPFRYVPFGSSVFGDLLNEENGLGYFEVAPEHTSQMEEIWNDFLKSKEDFSAGKEPDIE